MLPHVSRERETWVNPPSLSAFRSRRPGPPALLRKHSGSRRYSRDPYCPTHAPALRLRAAWLECMVRKLRKYLYRASRPSPNLCKSCLLTFAGKLDFGCVRATSATDLPMLCLRGVARKAWMSPACGPLSTVAMPEICPLSLILLAMVAKRLELAGNSVLRSVITPFCQMKAWDQLNLESKLLPTTWPLLLMPLASPAKSPGRRPRFVRTPSCQSAPYWVVPSELPTVPTIWPWSLMPWAIAPFPRSGSGEAVPFSHDTA